MFHHIAIIVIGGCLYLCLSALADWLFEVGDRARDGDGEGERGYR